MNTEFTISFSPTSAFRRDMTELANALEARKLPAEVDFLAQLGLDAGTDEFEFRSVDGVVEVQLNPAGYLARAIVLLRALPP